MAQPLAFPYRRPELLFATMWEELLSEGRMADARLTTSPHLPLHHLTAAFATLLMSYQVGAFSLEPPCQ